MKAAVAMMLDLVREATLAPEVNTIHVGFGPGGAVVASSKDWVVSTQTISPRTEGIMAFYDKDDVFSVELQFNVNAPAEWRKMELMNLVQAIKTSNLKRKRNQS